MFVLILYILTGSKIFQGDEHSKNLLLGLPSSLIWIEGALAEIDLATTVQVSETQRILKIPNLKHKYWKHCTGVRKNIENMCLGDHLLSNFLTCAFVDFVLFPAFVSSSFFSSSMGGGSGDMRRRYSCNIFISKNIDHLLVFVIKKTMRFIYLPFSDF